MRTIVPPADIDATLARWAGTSALFHAVSPTFRRSVLSLWPKGGPELLYLVCLGCRHIHGPFSWPNAQLRIERSTLPSADRSQSRVIDERADFELICSDVILVRGAAHEFPDPLEGFMPRE